MSHFRAGAIALILPFLGSLACSQNSAKESAATRADLDRVCQAQKSFLETRKLMKTVKESELAREREEHMSASVRTSLVRDALEESRRVPAGSRRASLEASASKAGVKGWTCPELDAL